MLLSNTRRGGGNVSLRRAISIFHFSPFFLFALILFMFVVPCGDCTSEYHTHIHTHTLHSDTTRTKNMKICNVHGDLSYGRMEALCTTGSSRVSVESGRKEGALFSSQAKPPSKSPVHPSCSFTVRSSAVFDWPRSLRQTWWPYYSPLSVGVKFIYATDAWPSLSRSLFFFKAPRFRLVNT